MVPQNTSLTTLSSTNILLRIRAIPIQNVRRVDSWLPILRCHDPVTVVDGETMTVNDDICCRQKALVKENPNNELKTQAALTSPGFLRVFLRDEFLIIFRHGTHGNDVVSHDRHHVYTQPVILYVPHVECISPQLALLEVLEKRIVLLGAHLPIIPARASDHVLGLRDRGAVCGTGAGC